MVNENIIVKKKMRPWKIVMWTLVTLITLSVIAIVVFFFLYVMPNISWNSDKSASVVVENPMQSIMASNKSKVEIVEAGENEFDMSYINYVLFSMGAWKLHSPPLSNDVPRIEFVIDKTYNSEIVDEEIFTYEGGIDDEDIIITSTKEEVINAILAEDMVEYMKQSVIDGKTGFNMKADNSVLFGKGYLVMYKDMTGMGMGEILEQFK